MEITYRLANIDDLDDIFQLIENAIQQMERNKIYQWDSICPTREDFNIELVLPTGEKVNSF